MRITDIIKGPGKVLVINNWLAKALGLQEAAFICNLIYWEGKQSDREGWIYKTAEEIEEETTLSYKQQLPIRKMLVDANVLVEKKGRRSLMYFKLDHDGLQKLYSKYAQRERIENLSMPKGNTYATNLVSNTRDITNNKRASITNATEEKEKIFNWPDYLKEMMSDSRRHIQIIGQFLKFKKLTFDKKDKVAAVISRHLRSAKNLTPFSPKELRWAANYCRKKYEPIDVDWTLETMLKALSSRSNSDEI